MLRGFTDVELQPGEGKVVNVTLSRYDLSVWDVLSQTWMRALGTYSLSVGASSRDFRLRARYPFELFFSFELPFPFFRCFVCSLDIWWENPDLLFTFCASVFQETPNLY